MRIVRQMKRGGNFETGKLTSNIVGNETQVFRLSYVEDARVHRSRFRPDQQNKLDNWKFISVSVVVEFKTNNIKLDTLGVTKFRKV